MTAPTNPVQPATRAAVCLRRFALDETASISIWAMQLFLVVCLVGAAAVDVSNLFMTRTQLQVAADSAAHAALLRRNQGSTSADAARSDAIDVAHFAMPALSHGRVIEPADIRFGRYDSATDTFTVDSSAREAVLVVAGRETASGNPVATYLFRLAGYGTMDVSASSVATLYQPRCLNVGLAAQDVVDIRSEGIFSDGICIHSNTHVEFNNGNTFEADDGVIVSMPDIADLVIPGSGMRQNPGLEDALQPGWLDFRVLELIRSGGVTPLETALLTPGDRLRPSYITSTRVETITPSNSLRLTPSSFTAGRIHRATCSGNQSLTFDPGRAGPTVYARFVLITNCELQFSGRVDLQDAIIYTTAAGSKSVSANSGGGGDTGLWLGREDACATGGGAQVVTRGGFDASAKITLNGGQIIALGDVRFAAQANGIGGAVTAGGRISATSKVNFAGCHGNGMQGNVTSAYFRLAR